MDAAMTVAASAVRVLVAVSQAMNTVPGITDAARADRVRIAVSQVIVAVPGNTVAS